MCESMCVCTYCKQCIIYFSLVIFILKEKSFLDHIDFTRKCQNYEAISRGN